MGNIKKVYEVNERILKEISKKVKDPQQKAFLLEILSYELEHFEEQNARYKEVYKKVLEGIKFKD
jgi:predicted transcriptional regulator